MSHEDAEVVSIIWTLTFGFLLPGVVLAMCPILLGMFQRWVEHRATVDGFALDWLTRRPLSTAVDVLADLRTRTAARRGQTPKGTTRP